MLVAWSKKVEVVAMILLPHSPVETKHYKDRLLLFMICRS